MSICALSSNFISDPSQQQNPFQEIQQDFKQLAAALQSGDLKDAQSAYSSIEQILEANGNSSTSADSSGTPNTLQNDFSALGQALQSGDLSQAQSAFSQFQNDLQAGRQSQAAAWRPSSGQGGDQYVSSEGQNPIEDAVQDYAELAGSLQSGNLTQAQSAYSNLEQLISEFQKSSDASSTATTSASTASISSSASDSGAASGESAIQTNFTTLGQDLQSGDLSAAQSAFSQLQTDLQSAASSSTSQANSSTPQANDATQPFQMQFEGHHHHHYGGGYSDATSGSTSSASSTSGVSIYG